MLGKVYWNQRRVVRDENFFSFPKLMEPLLSSEIFISLTVLFLLFKHIGIVDNCETPGVIADTRATQH